MRIKEKRMENNRERWKEGKKEADLLKKVIAVTHSPNLRE
jgi:hypothetical protein